MSKEETKEIIDELNLRIQIITEREKGSSLAVTAKKLGKSIKKVRYWDSKYKRTGYSLIPTYFLLN